MKTKYIAGVRPSLDDLLKSADEAAEYDLEDGFNTKLVGPLKKTLATEALYKQERDAVAADPNLRCAGLVAGIDEVGMGSLAGCVVAACVVLPDRPLLHVRDSKKLSAKARTQLEAEIKTYAITYGIGVATADVINEMGIRAAWVKAVELSILACHLKPDAVILDGGNLPTLGVPAKCVVKGDANIASIAAASILAKQYRDRYMAILSAKYPAYGFQNNSGYGTKQHLAALTKHGPCEEHRIDYGPVSLCTK